MRSKNILRYLLISVYGLILILPFVQDRFEIVKLPELNGYFEQAEESEFSAINWFSGNFQLNEDKYLNESFGFRSFFIRLNNQIDYSLFKKTHANSVIVGRSNCLYELKYLQSAAGEDFIGNDNIRSVVEKVMFIQQEFQKRNKTFLIVFTPGKGTFYNEYVPEKYRGTGKLTNYKAYSTQFSQKGINFIDFNSYFIDQKGKSEYPLYPKHGVHWSYYGMALSLDSLLKKIESLRKIQLHDIIIGKIEIEEAQKGDNDILKGLNLLYNPEAEQLAYPQIAVREWDKNDTKPSLLVIGDSFYWKMLDLNKSIFNPSHFWYYNREVHPRKTNANEYVINLNFEEEINKHDIFIIFSTEPNLTNLGWGFVDKAYNYLKYGKVDDKADFWASVKKMKENIRSNKEWFASIEKKAKELHISVDSALMRDAIWLVNQGKK